MIRYKNRPKIQTDSWRKSMFYKNLAPVYHHVFPVGNKAIFLNSHFKHDAKLLDVGSADGRVAKALDDMKCGYKITGIDLSEELIDVSKDVAKGSDNIHIIKLDMNHLSSIFPANSFEGIYCIGNTLVHLDNLNQISKVLSDLYKILATGGKLILQILNYEKILNEQITELPLIDNDQISFIRKYEFINEKINFISTLTLKNSGLSLESSTELFPLTQKHLKKALRDCGFNTINYYGDFSGTAYNENNLTLILVAEK